MAETAIYTTSPKSGTQSLVMRAGNAMSNFFVFNSEASEDDLALEVPDDAEETDLKRHATRCALRYRSLKKAQTINANRLRRIEIIILFVGGWLVTTSAPFHDLLKTLLGF